jgi:hypothetical protein
MLEVSLRKKQEPAEQWLIGSILMKWLDEQGIRPSEGEVWEQMGMKQSKKKLNLKNDTTGKSDYFIKTKSMSENWVTSLGWFIPRKYRNDVLGDILEDCAEMRKAGYAEIRIKLHVVYQWLIALITLVPASITTSITDILKQVLSPPK